MRQRHISHIISAYHTLQVCPATCFYKPNLRFPLQALSTHPLNSKPPNPLRRHPHMAQQLGPAPVETRTESVFILQSANKHLRHRKRLFPSRHADLLPHRQFQRPLRQAAPRRGCKRHRRHVIRRRQLVRPSPL